MASSGPVSSSQGKNPSTPRRRASSRRIHQGGRASPGGSRIFGVRYRWVLVLLQPVLSSQDVAGNNRSERARRVVQEEIVAGEQLEPPQRFPHAPRLGERGEHVGAEE